MKKIIVSVSEVVGPVLTSLGHVGQSVRVGIMLAAGLCYFCGWMATGKATPTVYEGTKKVVTEKLGGWLGKHAPDPIITSNVVDGRNVVTMIGYPTEIEIGKARKKMMLHIGDACTTVRSANVFHRDGSLMQTIPATKRYVWWWEK